MCARNSARGDRRRNVELPPERFDYGFVVDLRGATDGEEGNCSRLSNVEYVVYSRRVPESENYVYNRKKRVLAVFSNPLYLAANM